MEIHGITKPGNVMLVDDTSHNITLAKTAGMVGVDVSKQSTAGPEYLTSLSVKTLNF
jgi:FMN phosphatase YigB (HAD superfamily)